MAIIRAFKGLRFSSDSGSLKDLTAPPYDVISPEERAGYAAKNDANIVHLTLPEEEPGARSKFVKYARSAAQLAEWTRDGVLARDEEPSLYRYTQVYKVPGSDRELTRTKLITLIKVEPYSKGVVLPHEQTFPKHKEDRLRLLEACHAHLESIFGLIEDEGGSVHKLLQTAPAEPAGDFVAEEDGVRHVFERIVDSSVIDQISQALESKRVWIADGHHRYETALAFRGQKGEQPGLIAEDFMMIGLCSISDPGLVLLPTHRVLKKLSCSREELISALSQDFEIEEAPNSDLMSRLEAIEAAGGKALGVALPGGVGVVAKVRNLSELTASIESPGSERLRQLDVTILHAHIFAKLLGLTGTDFYGYTRVEQEALDAVENGSPAAFLMNPPTIDDMRVIAEGGEVMPQKSTYYYPKLQSGLVMWSLKDF